MRRNECVWLHHLHEKKREREREILEIEFKFNNSKRKSIGWHGMGAAIINTETISEDSTMDVGNSQQQ